MCFFLQRSSNGARKIQREKMFVQKSLELKTAARKNRCFPGLIRYGVSFVTKLSIVLETCISFPMGEKSLKNKFVVKESCKTKDEVKTPESLRQLSTGKSQGYRQFSHWRKFSHK
jgi:hypothetical protein